MKLLLTSNGFSNATIVRALKRMAGKPFSRLNLVFIPTAANVEKGNKGWLADDMFRANKLGFKLFDIVDFTAVPKDVWLPRIKRADILMFGGGNTWHLLHTIKKSGLAAMMPKLLTTRIYVGISAGSMVTAKRISMSQSNVCYLNTFGNVKDERGLGFVDFQLRPHLNSKHHKKIRIPIIERMAKKLADPVYAIDDETAIAVTGKKVTVVSEGKWKSFNKNL